MQQKSIHWFPGHMKKALKEIEERLKIMDVIIEIVDARAPISSRNPYLKDLAPQKKRLVVLAKKDLADEEETNRWVEYFKNEGIIALPLDLTYPKSDAELKKAIQSLGKDKWERDKRRGLKPQPLKTMIIGIPNVGKSTLINRLSRRNAASVQNTPGHTRAQQWIKVDQLFELLDTPGILPMQYEDATYSMHLAWLGSIKEDILPLTVIATELLSFLKEYHSAKLESRFQIEGIKDMPLEEIWLQIAKKRGLLTKGEPDVEKAERLLLKEFKDGTLGRITIEKRESAC